MNIKYACLHIYLYWCVRMDMYVHMCTHVCVCVRMYELCWCDDLISCTRVYNTRVSVRVKRENTVLLSQTCSPHLSPPCGWPGNVFPLLWQMAEGRQVDSLSYCVIMFQNTLTLFSHQQRSRHLPDRHPPRGRGSHHKKYIWWIDTCHKPEPAGAAHSKGHSNGSLSPCFVV